MEGRLTEVERMEAEYEQQQAELRKIHEIIRDIMAQKIAVPKKPISSIFRSVSDDVLKKSEKIIPISSTIKNTQERAVLTG